MYDAYEVISAMDLKGFLFSWVDGPFWIDSAHWTNDQGLIWKTALFDKPWSPAMAGIGPDDMHKKGARIERLSEHSKDRNLGLSEKWCLFPHDHIFDQEMMLVIASCWILGV